MALTFLSQLKAHAMKPENSYNVPEPYIYDSQECGTGHDGEPLYVDVPLYTEDDLTNAYAEGRKDEREQMMQECIDSAAQRQAECGTWRGKMQILVFDLWRDGVLTEQQCAAYTGEDLVQVRRLLDCEAAKRGYKCREDAQA